MSTIITEKFKSKDLVKVQKWIAEIAALRKEIWLCEQSSVFDKRYKKQVKTREKLSAKIAKKRIAA